MQATDHTCVRGEALVSGKLRSFGLRRVFFYCGWQHVLAERLVGRAAQHGVELRRRLISARCLLSACGTEILGAQNMCSARLCRRTDHKFVYSARTGQSEVSTLEAEFSQESRLCVSRESIPVQLCSQI